MDDLNIFLKALTDLPALCQNWLVGGVVIAGFVIAVLSAYVSVLSDELKPFKEQERLAAARQKVIAHQREVEDAARRLIDDGYGKPKQIELTDDGELVETASL